MAPRALFVSSTRIGDCVLSSGIVREIARRLPGAEITVACGPLAAPLFRSAPGVIAVHVMAKRPNGGHWLDLWKAAVGRRWDLVVDIRGSALAWLVPAKERRVFSSARDGGAHKAVEAGRLMGLDRALEPELFLDRPARADADALIRPDGRPILALAPVAAIADKTWAPENWRDLVRRLKVEPAFAGWRYMAVGGPGDAEAASPILEEAGSAGVDAVARLDILAAGAALDRAGLFVGNDSGTMHMSAAAGTPTLGLFGRTPWRTHGPWGARCRVLTASPTGEPASVQSLSVDRVVEALVAMRRDFVDASASR